MANHYHMVLKTPEANLDRFMNYFNRELSREIGMQTGRINQKFGARYYSSIIRDLRYYHNVYKYVYRNPIEANICRKVEDYRFSSLNFVLCKDNYRFPIFDSYFEFLEDHWPRLAWLNESTVADDNIRIEKALKKQFFEL